jgi:hypothetical protein
MNTIHNYVCITLIILGCSTPEKNQTSTKLEPNSPEYIEESKKIMDLIKLEHRAYFEKDYDVWQSTYVQTDYLKYWGFWEGYDEKVRQYNSWQEVSEDKKKRFDGDITAYWDENKVGMNISDLNIQIRGDVAWVTFKQITKDQVTGESLGEALETKILEKIDGHWKIAYLNFLYLPGEK